MILIEKLVAPHVQGFWGTILLFIAVAVRKVLPCLIIGKWVITSTEVGEFVAIMWKLRLPHSVIIPVSVVFRYFPTLKEEWQSLRMAMKMRGIHISMEHVFVPLMVSAINISDELSAAALCRGLDRPDGHSCLREIRFFAHDYIAIACFLLFAVATIVLKAGG